MGQNLCSNSMFRPVILGKEWHSASTVVFGRYFIRLWWGFCLVGGFWLVLFVFYFIQDNAISFPNYTGYCRWMWSLYFIWFSSEEFSADISCGFFPLSIVEILSLVHSEFQSQYQFSDKFTLTYYHIDAGAIDIYRQLLRQFCTVFPLKSSFVLWEVYRTCISCTNIPCNMQVYLVLPVC